MMLKLFILFNVFAVVYSQTPPACTTCPPNGIWSDWVAGSCSVTCGMFGTMTQTRTCISEPLGCPCDGASTTRNYPCPVSPLCLGTATQQCNLPYKKWGNPATRKNECGNVTAQSDDYVTPSCTMNGPACNFCSLTNPSVTIVNEPDSEVGTASFASDVITTDASGCSVRTFTCTALEGWGAIINVNHESGTLLAVQSSCNTCEGAACDGCSNTVSFSVTCNNNTAWPFELGGTFETLTQIGCQALTCENMCATCGTCDACGACEACGTC
ncbi:unnamed protein product, partial [Mesorhabditis belari]|uniref:Uncharacterized protein n=1 Tax=Mesorhabditis belari TaxID=2138241 RepID=A0AAF3FAY8_9BILA